MEHPVDFQVVRHPEVILVDFMHVGQEGRFWACGTGEVFIMDRGRRGAPRKGGGKPLRMCLRGGGGCVGGVWEGGPASLGGACGKGASSSKRRCESNGF
jgi:hypothetical protein